MSTRPSREPTSTALRLARKACRLQYMDAVQSAQLAERALAKAGDADIVARATALLARGAHRMRYVAPAEGVRDLNEAARHFDRLGDRPGWIIATAGIARCWWMQGRFRDALDLVLPLRAEGLALLKDDDRGFLLNCIAGCYSSLGQSALAFAYMYQALRDMGPVRSHGFDVVVYCNLAHELLMLGDHDEALNYVKLGLQRLVNIKNERLLSVLLINRVLALTDLGRVDEALPDIRRLIEIPVDQSGRGNSSAFESMALAALRAGDIELGGQLIERALEQLPIEALPDTVVELAVSQAELLRAKGEPQAAIVRLQQVLPLPSEGLSLRARCLFHQALAELYESMGQAPLALQQLRVWQRSHIERARQASQARYQAASLQTELLRLQRERDEIEARRRTTERAKSELQAMNDQLSQKMREVQALQEELRQQAVRDALTGLYNRRHLNEVLPAMCALAVRERNPLSVAIIDLDHFKAVNDRHGHMAGDMLLSEFGALLTRLTRKSDVACRYGGEEFCLLMPRTDVQAARRKVAHLLKLWRAMRFEFDTGVIEEPTFSAGVAETTSEHVAPQALLERADVAVFEAKRQGRQRVVVSGPQAEAPALPAQPAASTPV